MLNPFILWIEAKGIWAPWLFLVLFILASLLMIWRLESLNASGFEGTVLGTLIMPYCSGLGNLIFAIYLGQTGGSGADVMTNNLVNNVTDLTLVLGLPALIWGMRILPDKKKAEAGKKAPGIRRKRPGKGEGNVPELNRLSLLLTLLAVLFFTGTVWAMGRKGHIDFNDGLILIGFFAFWQCFHVFDVLKSDVRQGKSAFGWMFPLDIALLAVGAYGIYVSTTWLVDWANHMNADGFLKGHIGWFSGWLMVLPNALLALYYSLKGKPEVVYTSQVGDSHVSIPLCIGVYALYHTMKMPEFFQVSMYILLGATLIHFFFIGVLGRLPRLAGLVLVLAYAYFLKIGLLNS